MQDKTLTTLFYFLKPRLQYVNFVEYTGGHFTVSRLDYSSCIKHLENCFNLEVEYDL